MVRPKFTVMSFRHKVADEFLKYLTKESEKGLNLRSDRTKLVKHNLSVGVAIMSNWKYGYINLYMRKEGNFEVVVHCNHRFTALDLGRHVFTNDDFTHGENVELTNNEAKLLAKEIIETIKPYAKEVFTGEPNNKIL